MDNALKNGNGNGFDTVRRRVGSGVGRQLALETEIDVPLGREAWVRGPHTGKRLGNVT